MRCQGQVMSLVLLLLLALMLLVQDDCDVRFRRIAQSLISSKLLFCWELTTSKPRRRCWPTNTPPYSSC